MRRSLQAEMSRPHLIHEFENTPAATSHAREWIVGDDYGKAGLLHQQLVDIAQQRAAAGQYDAALGHICAELGWGLLERLFDGADDALQRFLQRFQYFVAVEREAARHAFRQVPALD